MESPVITLVDIAQTSYGRESINYVQPLQTYLIDREARFSIYLILTHTWILSNLKSNYYNY